MRPESWNDIYHANLLAAFVADDCELINHTFKILDPTYNLVESKARGFRKEFSDVMFEWIMAGEEKVSEEMLALNPNANKFATSYDFGDYYIVTAYGPRIKWQMDYIKGELKRDPNSRRACIMMLDGADQHVAGALAKGETKCEYICTYAFNFRIRKGKLDLTATMRSNNYTTTVCQDVYVFTRMLIRLAGEMGLEVGTYYHSTVSGHIFKGEERRAADILREYLYRPQGVWRRTTEQQMFESRLRIMESLGVVL